MPLLRNLFISGENNWPAIFCELLVFSCNILVSVRLHKHWKHILKLFVSPVTHHTSFMHGIHMGSRGGVKLHPCEKSIGQPRRNILCWGSCNLGQNKMKQRTPIPAKSRMKLHKRQNAPFSHPWFRGGGGRGINFPSILSKIVAYVMPWLKTRHE